MIRMVDYPEPEPIPRPLMLQSWCDLTFLHWRYPVEVVQRHVPRPLEVERFDGSAWVAVAPFVIRDLRPPFLPSLPWISAFPETNCRTYVKAPDGSSGVWFFSLDAARATAVAAARLSYGLPYAWSQMRVTRRGREINYQSRRIWPDKHAEADIVIEEGAPVNAGELEIFLTARFRLYSFIFGRLNYAKVNHPRWLFRRAHVMAVHQTLTEAAGLPKPDGPPVAHFSPRLDVRIGAPRRLVAANGSSD